MQQWGERGWQIEGTVHTNLLDGGCCPGDTNGSHCYLCFSDDQNSAGMIRLIDFPNENLGELSRRPSALR